MPEPKVTEPLYQVGQIVVLKSIKKESPFRILDRIRQHGAWYYAWNKGNFAAESMIRPLTDAEIGIRNRKSPGGES